MSIRSNYWSVTINNPTESDELNIASARQRGWKVEGQLEQGTQGTQHYQLLLQTPQVRFSAIKKAFPRAHIEVARNVSALKAYVRKEDTRVGSLKVDQSLYPSVQQLYQWFASYYVSIKREKRSATNLEIFDLMCAQKIRQGFYLDASIMNPQIRAFIKKFGEHLAHRELATLDRQTDRQPDLFSQGQSITRNAVSSSSTLQEETSDPPSGSEDDEGKET